MTQKEQRLSACLAQRDGVRTRTNKEFTEIQGVLKRAEFFAGLTKSYNKKSENGDDFPTTAVRVRSRVQDVLDRLKTVVIDQFNVEATVDAGNTVAVGDVVLNNTLVLLEGVPVTTLLTIEKDIKQVREFINKLPILDPAFEWSFDEVAGVYKTSELRANRQTKTAKPIVLYDATPEHPAQTQIIQVDEVVGEWVTVQSSGCIPSDTQKALLKKCDLVLDAVKVAREEANAVRVAPVDVGTPLINFIFG